MQRETKIRYDDIFKTYPLFFWRKCCMCDKEFRREKGWRSLTPPYKNGVGQDKYLCKLCAPSIDRAHEIFAKREWIKKIQPIKPPPPPGPPPKRVIREGVKIKKEK